MRTRFATTDDAPQIAAIYNHEVTSGIATFDMVPRDTQAQLAWQQEHTGAHPCIVAVDGPSLDSPDVVGWATLSPYRTRPAYATSVEDSVYVRHDRHGQGVGRLLLDELVDVAAALGYHAIFARIACEAGNTDVASVRLHRSCGFELVGIEREVGRKFGRWLDVALMQRLLVG